MQKRLACSVVLLITLALPVGLARGDEPSAAGHTLELRVVERDGGKPIAGVTVRAQDNRGPNTPTSRGTTDQHGACSIPVPPDTRYLHVHAWKDGFVPVRVAWAYRREFEFEGVPATYAIVLDRGTAIGGIVRDEQGRPVAGARVTPGLANTPRGEIEVLDLPDDAAFTTDAQGRWRGTILPESWKAKEIALRVQHPVFLDSGDAFDRSIPTKDLRDGSAVLVLETAYTVAGTVVGPDGKPVAGAAVAWRNAYGPETIPATTGPDGRFRFAGRRPGRAILTANAPGMATSVKLIRLGPADPEVPGGPVPPVAAPRLYVPVPPGPSLLPAPAEAAPGEEPEPPTVWPGSFPPDFRQVAKTGPGDPPLVIHLGPGRTIRGRVVAHDGRPVARARITPEIHGRTDLSASRAETDTDGRFEWKHAPLEMEVLKVEYPAEGQEVRRSAPGAGVTEIVLTMPRPFRLRGRIVDAETGRPIERCRLIEGVAQTYDFAPTEYESPLDWSRLAGRTIEGGRYEVRFPHEKSRSKPQFFYPVLLVRVEAEGYAPKVSRVFRDFEGEQSFDFALRRRPWSKGTVRAPDGSPAAGAEILVALKGQPRPSIYNGRLVDGWRGEIVRADRDGRYGLARPEAPGRIVLLAPSGMAQRTPDELAANPDVTLEPWGRIAGEVRVGIGPAARRLVGAEVWNADYRGEPIVSFTSRALTDAEGRFVMDHVAPGHAMVYRPSWIVTNESRRSHRQGVEVQAGQTAEVIVGGTGRPVIGRLTRAPGLAEFPLQWVVARMWLAQPGPEFPEGFDDWDDARRKQWWDDYYQTDEGRRYYENANSYAVKIGPDGSFRIDDVPEGQYWLVASYTEDRTEFFEQERKIVKVAVMDQYVEVPAGPDAMPLDLGELMLTPPEPEAVRE